MDPAVTDYIDRLGPEQRVLFDRIHRLILDTCPGASVSLAYKMPTYTNGRRRLHLGAWQHGLSLYGWKRGGAGDFLERHPLLQTSTGTIRLSAHDAAEISDEEFRELVRAALAP